jgi:hypothetical protein
VLHAAFVSLGFVFRNAEAKKSADNAAERADGAYSGKRGYDRSRGKQRAYIGHHKHTYANQPSKNPTDNGATRDAYCH